MAAAIPLVIHLFNFRRPQRVNFSSLAFLQELQKSTMQRVRIKQWLLLALRTLAIACLVLSFARPTLEGALAGNLGRGETSVAIVIDNSTSMTLRDAGGAYMDQAITIAEALISDMDDGDEVFLVPVQGPDTAPVAYRRGADALQALQQIAPAAGSARVTDGMRRAAAALAERPTLNKSLYVVTDGQASTLSDSLAVDAPGVATVLVPVGTQTQPNLAVRDVQVVSQIIAEGQPLSLQATLYNGGDTAAEGLVVSVFLEEERLAQTTVDIPAGGTSVATFQITPRRTGWLAGRIETDDPLYPFDNGRRFTVNVPVERSILLVSGGRSRFLELALSESLTGNRVRFRTDVTPENQLGATSLGGYDTVILDGVTDLSSGERGAIVEYVTAGGGLLMFPSDDMLLQDWNALLAALGGGSILGIEGVSTGEGETTASAGAFSQVDVDHPLFEGMFAPDPDGERPVLEQPAILRSIQYRAGGADEQTVIGLTSGSPFMQELRAGSGLALLMAVEANVRWSDFPVRGLFVPILYRSLYYLSASGSVAGENLTAGESAQIRVAADDSDTGYVIRDRSGRETLPAQRTVLGATLLDVTGSFFEPGVFDVASGDRVARRFVVHPDPAESMLAPADREDARAHLASLTGGDVQVLDFGLAGGASAGASLEAARTGIELWNVFLALALVCMLLEMVVARRWRPESAPS